MHDLGHHASRCLNVGRRGLLAAADKFAWTAELNLIESSITKVVAGENDTYRIDSSGYWNNDQTGRSGRLTFSNWFAPATRCIVKTDDDDGYNSGTRQGVEFDLQP